MKSVFKKVLSFILVAAMLFGSAPLSGLELPSIGLLFSVKAKAATSGTCGTGLTWTFDESTGTLTITGTGNMSDYSRDYLYGGATTPWKGNTSKIKSVIISDGVTRIGSYAFYYFSNLSSITIPDSVTSIGGYVFNSCSSLTQITIPDSVTTIGEYAFNDCTSLSSITLSNNIKEIYGYTFANCKALNSITIPESVISIGACAFSNCSSITNITIPQNVASINSSAFNGCTSIISFNVSENNVEYSSDENGVLFNKDKTELLAYPPANTATSYTIPDSVTTINADAFNQCSSIKSITIPVSVVSIGTYAFGATKSLLTVYYSGTLLDWFKIEFESHLSNPLSSAVNFYANGMLIQGDVSIPEGVSSIGPYALYGYVAPLNLTIPEGVTSIGYQAFENCENLKSISIPDTVTKIEGYAFRNCISLEELTIPDSVETIDTYAFYNCSSLKDLTIGNGLKSISDYTFFSCDALQNLSIGNSVESIGENAFEDCISLKELVLPDGLKTIGYEAFYNCPSISSVTIPSSITSIDGWTFYSINSSINDVYFSGELADWLNIEFTGFYANPLYYADNLYLNGILLEGDIVIPDNVTKINPYSFLNYKLITSITIPEGVTEISDDAFRGCSALTSVTIPNSVTTIGSYAFADCSSLQSIVIPAAVSKIESFTFSGCTSLSSVTIPGSVTSIGSSAFSDCSALKSITIPNGVTTIGASAFKNCSSLETVTIPASVTSIADDAFLGCTSLKNINLDEENTAYSEDEYGVLFNKDKTTLIKFPSKSSITAYEIPDSVTNIYTYAFYNCSLLETVTIPDSVTNIGSYAFNNCTSISEIDIPNSVTTISGCAFDGCTALESVTLPNGITNISYNLFSRCTSLKNITIPNGVKNINSSVFYNCTALENVIIPDSVTTIGDSVFRDCTSLKSITIPNSVTNMDYGIFSDCTSLTNVTISENITRIQSATFAGCTSLKSITIPEGVTRIDEITFKNCTALESVNLPASVTEIRKNAFNNCSSLKNIFVDENNTVYSSSEDGALLSKDRKTLILCLPGYTSSTTYEIPDYIEKIESEAFINNISYTSIIIPASVTSVSYRSLNYLPLENIYVSPDNQNYSSDEHGVLFNKDKTALICYPDGKTLTHYVVPNSVTYIGTSAFNSNEALTSLIMLGNLESILNYNLDNSSLFPNLKTLVFSTKIQSIGRYSFSCIQLDEIYYKGSESQWREFKTAPDAKNIYFNFQPYDTLQIETDNLEMFVGETQKINYKDNLEFKDDYEDEETPPLGFGGIEPITPPTSTITSDIITFTSSDESIATVSNDGTVTGISEGVITVTLRTISGLTATCIVTVKTPLFNLTFDENGGSEINDVELLTGEVYTLPECVREGYTFSNWTDEDGNIYNAGDLFITPGKDVVLTAVWSVNKYKVKWNIDGMTMSQNIKYGSEIPVPDDPEKEGYTFTGWSPEIPELMPAQDMTFTATWAVNEYEISWIIDGNTTVTKIAYGEPVMTPPLPTKPGHTFAGWSSEIPETMPASDLTFTAIFSVNSYNVTWIVDDKATVNMVEYGSVIERPENPTKEGYKFVGWSPSIPATMPDYDMAFVAQWKEDYKISFPEESIDIIVNSSAQPEVVITPEPVETIKINWSSSDETIATVDENGVITGISCGTAIITAELEGKTAFITVNVIHDYSSETIEATCTENGFTLHTCSVCGDQFTDNLIEAKGHSYKTTVVESSCTDSGYTKYECTVCSHTYTDNLTPAAGHKYDEIIIQPTCTKDGYVINMCSVCGQAYRSEIISATGHNYSLKVIEATCISKGYTIYTCLNCGESYEDDFVDFGEHNYIQTAVVEPTCTENGYTEYTCSQCNDKYVDNIVEPKGHVYTTVTNPPTCTNGGYTLNVCDICGASSITNQTQSLGHDYITNIVPATCESGGYTIHTCTRGDHVYKSDETEAIGHNFEPTEIKATCIQNGCILNICLNCGRVNKSDETPAHGHSFYDWKTIIQPAENVEGLQTRTCKNCGYTEEKILPMLQKTTYTATFVADGNVVSYVEFLKGTTEITEPDVPQKHRYTGEWEEYTLSDSDITINAKYTLIDLDDLSGIDFNKNASYNSETGEATISLYAASEAKTMISQTSKKVPLDIVLVVDQSGSMAEKLGGKVSKQEALIDSANGFVNSVYNDAAANGVDHRIAVVGFGMGNKSQGFEYPAYLNTEILTTGSSPINMNDAKPADYASALMYVNQNGAINADIVNAVNSIDAKGATAADFGLSMACNVFANNAYEEGRQRIVVFMTDGEPTYSSEFSNSVATAAIQQAYQLKNTYGAAVYSVGIFNNANNQLNKFMNYVSSNCSDSKSILGNSETQSDKFFLNVSNTDALSSVFTEIVVENITRTTDFDNITLIDTVSEYFTLTSQQEKALRISAIEKFGIRNSDINITRNPDGTTTIEIKSIHPQEIGDKFVVALDFNVSANENAFAAGNYATNTEDAGIIVGDADNYECIFDAPSVNIPADRNTVIFKVNGDIYAISSLPKNAAIIAPETDFIGDYKFTGWNIPEGAVANQPKMEFEAALVNQEYVAIWNTADGTETVTYAPGDVINVPSVGTDKNGDAFRRWNGDVPITMPANSIEFTAVYGDHEHKYVATTIKEVTCLENGEVKYTCSVCESTYSETIICAGKHTWKAITGPADKDGHATEIFKCDVCGVSDDMTLEYKLLDDGDGNIRQEFNYVDENGSNCQPDGKLTITVPLDEFNDVQDVNVYRENDDGTKTQCDSRFENGILEFDTDHFSTYIFEPVYYCEINGVHTDSNNDGKCDICKKSVGITITWVIDDKKVTVNAIPGEKLVSPESPKKEGYSFAGWTPTVPAIVPDSDVTFYAMFSVKNYTVTWNVDGNTTMYMCQYGSELLEPSKPEKAGYYFLGWSPAVPEKMPAKNMTFTAIFVDYDPSKIKVTITNPDSSTVVYGEPITLHANASNLPRGAKIKWTADNNCVDISPSNGGKSCTVTAKISGNVIITAYVVDANGNVIKTENGKRVSDSEGITSEVTLWSIIIYSFKQMLLGNPFFKFIFKGLFI